MIVGTYQITHNSSFCECGVSPFAPEITVDGVSIATTIGSSNLRHSEALREWGATRNLPGLRTAHEEAATCATSGQEMVWLEL